MNILYLTPYYPSLQATHAGGVHMAAEITELRKKHNVYVAMFIQGEEELELRKTENPHDSYYVYTNNFKKIVSIISNPTMPILFSIRRSKEMQALIDRIIKEKNIDAIYAQYSAMGQYLNKLDTIERHNKTIYLHDVVAQSYIRLEEEAKGIKALFYKNQLKKIIKYEKKYINDAGNVITASNKDVELVERIYHRRGCYYINPYTDLENNLKRGKQILENKNRLSRDLFYMGLMSREENVEAAERLISIYKKLNRSKIRSHIIGNKPPERIIKLGCEDIIITGYVENPDEYMSNCGIAVFPIATGAGVKLKVIRALAMGIPVITTTVGAEGIDSSGKVIILAETDDEFIKEINTLLQDDELYWEKSEQGIRYVEENFGWEKTKEVYEELFR